MNIILHNIYNKQFFIYSCEEKSLGTVFHTYIIIFNQKYSYQTYKLILNIVLNYVVHIEN